jgi:DNA-binding response OmpR family regulator
MKKESTILFVDDEPGIRTTLPAILTGFGFKVTAAATVPEALNLIATQPFEVLISDLNIGQPGDGLTVVSAMRRTQPSATTFILTGYPAFETALEAIRQQVDDYLIKPMDIGSLVEKIRVKLSNPRPMVHHIEPRRLTEILEQNKAEIVERWLKIAKKDRQILSTRLSDRELSDHLPSVIEAIIGASREPKLSPEALRGAALHGRTRFKQGCTIPAVIREARILQDVVGSFVQENLLGADISWVIPDVMRLGETLQAVLEESIRAYVQTRHATSEHIERNKAKSVLLLVSADRELALLRAHVLEHAGFAVTAAASRKEALDLLKEKYDALVISYSTPGETIVEMAELFRQKNPNSPIITVAKGGWQDLGIHTDFAVTGEDGPAALIEAIEAALNRKQLRRIK